MSRAQISGQNACLLAFQWTLTPHAAQIEKHHTINFDISILIVIFSSNIKLHLLSFIPDVSIKANKWTRWNHSTFSYTYLSTIFMALCQAMLSIVNIYSLTIYVFINMVAGVNPVTDNYDSAYKMTTSMRMRKQGKISFQFLENTQRFLGKKKSRKLK